MVNKDTFVGFKGAISPPTLGFAPVVTGIMVRSTPEIRFLPGQLRWTFLAKKRYGDSLIDRGSVT